MLQHLCVVWDEIGSKDCQIDMKYLRMNIMQMRISMALRVESYLILYVLSFNFIQTL